MGQPKGEKGKEKGKGVACFRGGGEKRANNKSEST